MRYTLLLLFFLAATPCLAQNNGDLEKMIFGGTASQTKPNAPASNSTASDYIANANRHFDKKSYNRAEELYKLAKLYAEQNRQSAILIEALTKLGFLHEIKNDDAAALEYFRRAYDISDSIRIEKKIEQNTPEAYSHRFMTEVEGKIKYNTTTVDSIKKTIAIKQSLNDTLSLSINYFNLGLLYKSMQKYADALNAFENALMYAQKIYYAEMQLSAVNQIADLYEFTGDVKQALSFVKKRAAIISLLNSPKAKTLDQLQTSYDQREAEVFHQKLELTKRNYWVAGISVVTVLLLVIGFIYYKQTQLRQRNIAMQAIIKTEESERQRIARDLHDSVSQTMSAAKINLSIIGGEISFKDEEQKRRFERAVGMVDDGFKEVRTISHNMMPWALHKAGLAQVIKQFVGNLENGLINFSFFSKGFEEPFNETVELILYRVLQESVNNVIKHAGASRVDISLIRDEESISLTIEDNGRGFDANVPEFKSGMGLGNLRSRINFLNGKVEVHSQPGSGTLVSVYIPVKVL